MLLVAAVVTVLYADLPIRAGHRILLATGIQKIDVAIPYTTPCVERILTTVMSANRKRSVSKQF